MSRSPTASQTSASSLDGDLDDSPRHDGNANNNNHSNRSGDGTDGSRDLCDECNCGDSKSTDQTSLVSSSFTLNRSAASTYTATNTLEDNSGRSADNGNGNLPAELGLRLSNSQGSSRSGINGSEEDFRPHPVQPLKQKEKSIYISSLPSIRGSTISTPGDMADRDGSKNTSLNLEGSITLPEVFQTSAADLGPGGEVNGGADQKIKGAGSSFKSRSDASMETEAAANLRSASSLATADIGDSHGSSNLNDNSISVNNLENSNVNNNNSCEAGEKSGHHSRRSSHGSDDGGHIHVKTQLMRSHTSSSQMSGHNSSSSVGSGSESQRLSRGSLNPRLARRMGGHHESTSSEASDVGWMDVSFSSTSLFDKALVSNFEDMLSSTDRGNEGLDGQTSLLSTVRRGLASIPSVRTMGESSRSSRTDFNNSGFSNNFNNSEVSIISNGNSLAARAIGGAAVFNLSRRPTLDSSASMRSKESGSLAMSDIRDDDGDSCATPADVIPKVFKTLRRNSKSAGSGGAGQSAVVHVDGGGDFTKKTDNKDNPNWGVFQSMRMGRRSSNGSESQGTSSVTGPSEGSAARPRHLTADGQQQQGQNVRRHQSRRRSSDGSQQSADTLTGFQVLQSEKQTSASTLGEGEARLPHPSRRPSDRSRGPGGPRRRPRRLTVESESAPAGSISPPTRYQPAQVGPRQSSSGDLALRTGGLNDSTVTMVTSNVEPSSVQRTGGAGLGGEDDFGKISVDRGGVKSRTLMPDYSHSVQYAKQHSLIPGPDDSDSRQYDGESLSLDDPSYPSRSILDYPPPMRGDGSGGIDDNECDRKLVEQAGGPAYHIASRGVRVMRIAVVGTIVTTAIVATALAANREEMDIAESNLAVVVASLTALCLVVFLVYDYFVSRRQQIVVRSAAKSARIVANLYPEFARNQLFGRDTQKSNGSNSNLSGDAGDMANAANNRTRQSPSDPVKNEYDEESPPDGGGMDAASVPRSFDSSENCAMEGFGSRRSRRGKIKVSDFVDTPATKLKRFLAQPAPTKEYDSHLNADIGLNEPIAEVFEKTTVMLADIEGFTAWCSEREPCQVFRLLETVYREFDLEARKLGVFKVETVGDCYVAVTGLPDPREDHAVVIAKYAVRCLLKFNVMTKRLEATLGPGTASLGMRFGLHSGPVTAGVLRGEKSRFQLFGDTINVASRMESTGEKNLIQVSQATAEQLRAFGKGHWLTPRDTPVSAKGKGSIQTFWLQPNRRRPSLGSTRTEKTGEFPIRVIPNPKHEDSLDEVLKNSWAKIGITNDSLIAKERLIHWNAAILESFLLKIVDNRLSDSPESAYLELFEPSEEDKVLSFSEPLSEKVMFPEGAYREDYYGVSSDAVIAMDARLELLEYVASIASKYNDVPFHNFDHASHVTMSASKLINKVCASYEDDEEDVARVAARTFGISADPLAQFVVVFSSLVHDVEHQGVPNAILVKEKDPLAIKYENRSVAEKRSINIAWDMLMEDRFTTLRSLIFVNSDEMRRFKQLLLNTVLATDIADKERSKIGRARWQKAFHPSQSQDTDQEEEEKLDEVSLRSLKATLTFEQIMQASDVAHTMQHWQTFLKWNRRLYKELSKGYSEGRGTFDPRDGWYKGEIGFFDFYIIPLARKLKDCGVFGSAATEYLDHALEIRRRWEEEGEEIAERMIAEHDEALRKALEKEAKESKESKKGEAKESKESKKDEVEESKESKKDEANTSPTTLESTETSKS
mmetsp:Transcript_12061/g.27486  ORF Transcript_12061/g.27486 Transcript_12061/m.27486 type:complete len:1731 (+) Transcript_12061:313-5505(+)